MCHSQIPKTVQRHIIAMYKKCDAMIYHSSLCWLWERGAELEPGAWSFHGRGGMGRPSQNAYRRWPSQREISKLQIKSVKISSTGRWKNLQRPRNINPALQDIHRRVPYNAELKLEIVKNG